MPFSHKIIPAILFLLALSCNVFASHIIGGEMSYKCLGNNVFEITVKIYRDCYNGIPPLDNPAIFTIYDGNGNEIRSESIPLITDSVIPAISTNPCIVIPPNVCVEEGTYVFDETLPPIPGGYTFAYQICCRNASVVNIQDPGDAGSTFAVTIDSAALVSCDNSPVFTNYPPIDICGFIPLVFNHAAIDPDGDSLVYYLCLPLDGPQFGTSAPPYTGAVYNPPYIYNAPMDASPQLKIDSKTGLLTVTPTALGQYLVGICVDEYRKGVLMGTLHRDFQFNVLDCHSKVLAAIFPQGSLSDVSLTCTSSQIAFPNNSIGGTSYHWDFGVNGVTNDTSNVQFPSFIFPDTGTYPITLIVNPGSQCGDTAEATVQIYPNLTQRIVITNGCQDLPVQFSDSSTFSAGLITGNFWSFGDSDSSQEKDPTHIYKQTGSYSVTEIITTDKGCSDTTTELITIDPAPYVFVFPKDTTIVYGTSVQLLAQFGVNYEWYAPDGLSDATIDNPIAAPLATTTYHVIVSNANGCRAMDSLVVKVVDDPIVIVPNAFSPNSDGHNDVFAPIIIGLISDYDFKIYNRWGEQVFETKDPEKAWNGYYNDKPQDIGIFVYSLHAVATVTGKHIDRKGNVALLK